MHHRIALALFALAAGCAGTQSVAHPARPPAAYPLVAEGLPNSLTGSLRFYGTVYDQGNRLVVVLRSGTVQTAPNANGVFNGLSVELVSGNPDGKWYSEAQSAHRRLADLPLRGDSLADSIVFEVPDVRVPSLTGHWIVVHEWRVAPGAGSTKLLFDRPIPSASTIFDR